MASRIERYAEVACVKGFSGQSIASMLPPMPRDMIVPYTSRAWNLGSMLVRLTSLTGGATAGESSHNDGVIPDEIDSKCPSFRNTLRSRLVAPTKVTGCSIKLAVRG